MLLFLTRHQDSSKHIRKPTTLTRNMFAALAYDSVYMIAEASKGAKTSVDIADNLAHLKNFVGVTGKMTIDKDHNPIKAALMVKRDNGEEVSAEAVEIEK